VRPETEAPLAHWVARKCRIFGLLTKLLCAKPRSSGAFLPETGDCRIAPTAWLGREDSNSDVLNVFVCLSERATRTEPAETQLPMVGRAELLPGTQPGHHLRWERLSSWKDWRSLGDSNPRFRRERAETPFSESPWTSSHSVCSKRLNRPILFIRKVLKSTPSTR